jgi:hypothetical protein
MYGHWTCDSVHHHRIPKKGGGGVDRNLTASSCTSARLSRIRRSVTRRPRYQVIPVPGAECTWALSVTDSSELCFSCCPVGNQKIQLGDHRNSTLQIVLKEGWDSPSPWANVHRLQRRVRSLFRSVNAVGAAYWGGAWSWNRPLTLCMFLSWFLPVVLFSTDITPVVDTASSYTS